MPDANPLLADIEELEDYVEKLRQDARAVERRARVMKVMAARAAEALTDLRRRVTEDNGSNQD